MVAAREGEITIDFSGTKDILLLYQMRCLSQSSVNPIGALVVKIKLLRLTVALVWQTDYCIKKQL